MGLFSFGSKPSLFLVNGTEVSAEQLGYACANWSLDTADTLIQGILGMPTVEVTAPDASIVGKLKNNPLPARLQLLSLSISTYHFFCKSFLKINKVTSDLLVAGTESRLIELCSGAGDGVLNSSQLAAINAAIKTYLIAIVKDFSSDINEQSGVITPFGDPVCELTILNIFKVYQTPAETLQFSSVEAMMAITPLLSDLPARQITMIRDRLQLSLKAQ